MLARPFLIRRKFAAASVAIAFLLVLLSLCHPASKSHLYERVSAWRSSASHRPLALPADYDTDGLVGEPQSAFCNDRFSPLYLEHLRDHAVSYCSPGSRSNITCFHSHTALDGTVDSLCIGSMALLDASRRKFELDCPVRTLDANETARGLIQFNQLRGYWYGTGPSVIFNNFIDVRPASSPVKQVASQGDEGGGEGGEGDQDAPRFYLLLKREGEGNLWHCLMEIWSAWMTMDVLRMARDPHGRDAVALFQPPRDVSDTQVVILDDRADGPYFDLWTLFARRPPVRLRELLSRPVAAGGASIVVPLAGATNPLWQGDARVDGCTRAPNLDVFARRVLGFYNVADDDAVEWPTDNADDDVDEEDGVVVTFVDRTSHRRLVDQEALLARVRARTPRARVRFVDFAAIPLAEQLRVARATDVLVGVHGAGLTHALFMREGAGAVVEAQPLAVQHEGFRHVAAMRRLGYFRVAGTSVPRQEKGEQGGGKKQVQVPEGGGAGRGGSDKGGKEVRKRDDWHWADVRVEPEAFLDAIDAAIKSLYDKDI